MPDNDKTISARLDAIAARLEASASIVPDDAYRLDASVATRLKRIEDAIVAGALTGSLTDHALGTHTDTQLTSPGNKSFLQFDSSLNAWKDSTALFSDAFTDVSIAAPVAKQFLRHNGTIWSNSAIILSDLPAIAFDDLSDVSATGPVDKSFALFRTGSGLWEHTPANLQNLKNVVTIGLIDGETIVWESVSQTWQNVSLIHTGFLRRDGTTTLTADWNAGDFDITADAFISNLIQTSSQHINFDANNTNTVTAAVDTVTYRGLDVDLDYTYNNGASVTVAVVDALRLTCDVGVTAGTYLATSQAINADAVMNVATTVPAYDFRVTSNNSGATFGGTASGAALISVTTPATTFSGIRSEANASSASAVSTDSANGYFGFSAGANTYTGNLVGVRGFTGNITGANATWGLFGTPGAAGGTIAQNRRIAIGGLNGHFYANGGSLILESAIGATFRRPADITTTHLNFLSNYGELYCQGQSEFDGTAHFDGDFDHNGTNVGFYGIAPVARSAAYTQTYATATRIHSNPTATSVATTAATNVAPFGYTTAAQADSIPVAINAAIIDIANIKQVVNQILDDFQLIGLLQ